MTRPLILDLCTYCNDPINAPAPGKKFCSIICGARHRRGYPKERGCQACGETFAVEKRGDANRRYCSRRCSRVGQSRSQAKFNAENPEAMKGYNRTRKVKNPELWIEKRRKDRLETLRMLGGACIVCGVDNPLWLHVDYKPGCRGRKVRHPNHPAFVRRHLQDFRILCANHHYELTLTGRIEGTEIVQ